MCKQVNEIQILEINASYTDLVSVLGEINECGSNPCEHGAICRDLPAAYVCDCSSGYTGENCASTCLLAKRNFHKNNT